MPPDATHEPGRMQGFVAALLRHEGALVEAIEPDGLEVLAPPKVQDALAIGELSRLGFGPTLPPAAQRVGIEGDWLERFSRLLGPRGRSIQRILSAPARSPGDAERVLGHELRLDNATFRLLDVTPAWTRYLVLDFRASAVSDDKRDFVLRLGVNLATGALPDPIIAAVAPELDSDVADAVLPEDATVPASWDRSRVAALVARALPPRLEVALDPFVKGLRRRLGRDQDRLHRYHNDLYREAMARLQVLPEGDPKRARDEQRAAAIAREYRARLDDLTRQYATRVSVEWFRTLELTMPVQRLVVQVRRRKAERVIKLDWNPIARRLESPACEYSASTERPTLACDDAMHLVVPAGLAPCTGCGRAFCRVCHGERCPKCGADGPARPMLTSGMLQVDPAKH